ncbi:MAG: hypothetical protein AAFO81_06400 [Pseudomonadota bacterium]
MNRTVTRLSGWLLGCCLLVGCAIPLANYDQRAYENATSLKPLALAMIDRSMQRGSWLQYNRALEDLLVQLAAAYEYANGIEYNNEAAANWKDLIGDEERMMLGWATLWSNCGDDTECRVSPALATEYKIQATEAFDIIICLEANKRQLSRCEALTRPTGAGG